MFATHHLSVLSRNTLLTASLLCLFGCQPDDHSLFTLAELHQALQHNQLEGNDAERRAFLAEAALKTNIPDSLATEFTVYRAENAYETLHYEEALQFGREAMSRIQQQPSDSQLPSLFRAANLLGKLHYEHWNFVDSTTFYHHLVHELRKQLPPSDALDLELALLKQLDQRTEYLFPEIDTEVSTLEKTDLFTQTALDDAKAQLKILQAISIRKQRHEIFTKEGLDSLFRLSLVSIEQAIAFYQEQQSPRLGHALEEFGLHQAMLGSDEAFAAACKAIEEQQSTSSFPVRYGYPARLKAMRASKDGLAAALPYYREVYPQIPPFNTALRDEATYTIEEVAKEQKDYQQLWNTAFNSLTNGRCASLEVVLPKELTVVLPQTNVCRNILIDLAVAKRIEYEQTLNPEALELARQYNDFILKHWAEDRAGSNERSLLYQLYAFGAEGLDNAIITEYHHQKNRTNGPANSLFERMEANRSLLLRRDMAKRNKALRTPRYLLEDSLHLIEEQLNALAFARTAAGASFQKTTERRFTMLASHKSDLQRRISRIETSEDIGMLFNISPPTKTQLAKEGILSFSWTTDGLLALALNDRKTTAYRIDTTALKTDIDSLRTLLDDTTPNKAAIIAYQELAASLYQRLVQPAAAALPAGKPLLIIPDKHLSKLPFEALLTEVVRDAQLNERTPFFLHRHRIRYAPSWAVDQQAPPVPTLRKQQASVAVLAHTQLHGYFAETHQLLSRNTSSYQEHVGMINSADLQRLTAQANIFHLSAHAEGDPTLLQNNFIHLSPNDKINAASIETLDLTGKLVVLAACETGLGQQRDGEGVYTISRSFRLAGASGVVSSLWQVKGLPTQALIKEFYSLLFAGVPPAEALWRAKVKMANGKGAKPWYWWPGSWAGVVG